MVTPFYKSNTLRFLAFNSSRRMAIFPSILEHKTYDTVARNPWRENGNYIDIIPEKSSTRRDGMPTIAHPYVPGNVTRFPASSKHFLG
jgi:hypothetical protein